MPKNALPDRRVAGFFVALAVLCGLAAPARAAPLSLDTEDEMNAFAQRVRDYSDASLVRWTIVAPTKAEAEARIAAVTSKLPPTDRGLALRLIAQGDGQAHGALAYVSPQIGKTGGSCSWQVWVTDPDLPAADGQSPVAPLATHDRMPVGPKATFRVGHFGLVQTKLYAFDETNPGEIRDLSTVQNADIPVPKAGPEDYIVLAAARKAAPFLERFKSALAASQGERRELGPEYALREGVLGPGRGIGANIEILPSSMIARKATVVASAKSQDSAESEDTLMETCQYSLTPSR